MNGIEARLQEMAEPEYAAFQRRLMPTVAPERVLGVRTPLLRAFAKELGSADAAEFMRLLPHKTYDENNLHGFLIERIKDYEGCVSALEGFLPYVDNWATCDMTNPRALRKEPEALFDRAAGWISREETFVARFGVLSLMRHYLHSPRAREAMDAVAALRREEYYVRMAQAWFFATALTKQYETALGYIEDGALPPAVLAKAVQKACESRMIPKECKIALRKCLTSRGDAGMIGAKRDV